MESQKNIIVSVIMLTYNHVDYIRQAIESIISQETEYKYELLIGDDCSNDGTSRIVKEYAKKYPDIIKAYIREKNLGATNNLCELFKAAKGKYIASCEGDDYWINNRKLQIQVDFLEKNECYIGCTHKICLVDEKGELLPENDNNWILDKAVFSIKDFDGFKLPGHAVSMVYRNIFNTEELIETIRNMHWLIADRTIVAMLLVRGEIYNLDDVMAAYRFKRERGGKGATNNICDYHDHFYQEYKYTKRLEKYVSEASGQKTYFMATRRHFIMDNIREVWNAHRVTTIIYIPAMLVDYAITELRRVIENAKD